MIKRLPLLLALGLGGAWILRTYFFEAVYVASASMEPTLLTGTHYLVNRCIYRLHPARRGDVVVIRSPIDPATGLIKRVIAVGGDRIELRDKKVYLNGGALNEPYTQYKRASERLVGDNLPPITVPADCVFVLGDNRDVSEDSSDWKDPKTKEPVHFVPEQNIEGRVMIP